MAGMGLLWEEIAEIVGVSVPTLRKYYLAELRAGTPKATARVAQSLFKQATDPNKPNVIAAIFWLKARAGWRDHEAGDRPGKKQLRAEAAKDAGASAFAPRKTPTLVVDNTKKAQ
jgi:hypothetical protein